MVFSQQLKTILDKYPGKKFFGVYRFLPIFFVIGAAIEFSMINWWVGQTNFYKIYKVKQAKKIAKRRFDLECYKHK